nr:MAG TPA: hypothetical protein [Caudoviricetes sp.]
MICRSDFKKKFFGNCIKQCNFHRVFPYIWR